MTAQPPASGLAELAAAVNAFADERGWGRFHTPKNLAMALAGEVGELLAELQWLTPEESALVLEDPEAGARLRAELGDVTIYLVRLAEVLGLDLVAAARDKLAEADRRYPAAEAIARDDARAAVAATRARLRARGSVPDAPAG